MVLHYFNFHIGDFNSSARHLNLIERAIYRDLMDYYYLTEQPICVKDLDKVFRKLLCQTEDEKNIAMAILDEFFYLEDDHYHNDRCDREIAEYKAKAANFSKAGKISAEKRKEKSKILDQQQEFNSCSTVVANQQLITKNRKTVNQKTLTNSEELPENFDTFPLNDLLKLWDPNLEEVNKYLKASDLNHIDLEEFNRSRLNFLSYYSKDIQMKKLDGTKLMGKFVSWIQRQREWKEKKVKLEGIEGQSPWGNPTKKLEKLVSGV